MLKEKINKIYALDNEIYNMERNKRKYVDYINHIENSDINHIGFDYSNKEHFILHDEEMNTVLKTSLKKRISEKNKWFRKRYNF